MPAPAQVFALGGTRIPITLESDDLPGGCGNGDTGVAIGADADALVEPLIHDLGLPAAHRAYRAGWEFLPLGRQWRHYDQIYRTAEADSSAAVARNEVAEFLFAHNEKGPRKRTLMLVRKRGLEPPPGCPD